MTRDRELAQKYRRQHLEQLTRIANALEALVVLNQPEQPPAEPEQTEPLTCPHPTESRIPLGMTDGKPDWQCGICREMAPR